MGRILALDYGKKRTGIAVTDVLKITANPLDTIQTNDLLPFLDKYLKNEDVEGIVVGLPRRLDNTDTHVTQDVIKLVESLKKKYQINVYTEDEKFTSKLAVDAMITGGMKKKERQKKENIDRISATIILQSFLSHHF